MYATVPISVDLVLILRILAAFLLGLGLTVFLQSSRWGRFLAKERTWVTVVFGVGGTLLCGIGGDWLTVCLCFAAICPGLIVRSLANEHRADMALNLRSYKLLWALEDTIVLTGMLRDAIDELLEKGELSKGDLKQVAQILSISTDIGDKVKSIRSGNYRKQETER